jgi:DNA-binding FadR family transcriptional regulator
MKQSAPTSNKQRQVMDALLDIIQAEGLGAGDRLPAEVDLARRLGLGRGTVREAFKSWEAMGIVTRNKGAGTVLATDISGREMHLPLSVTLEAESLARTLAVRRPLEIEAVRIAARAASERQRHEIRGLMLELMERYESGGDWREADHRFHAAIHDATGNPLFGQLIGQLQRAFHDIYEAPFGQPQLGHATIPQHRDLAEAVVAGKADRAATLMAVILDDVIAAAAAMTEREQA